MAAAPFSFNKQGSCPLRWGNLNYVKDVEQRSIKNLEYARADRTMQGPSQVRNESRGPETVSIWIIPWRRKILEVFRTTVPSPSKSTAINSVVSNWIVISMPCIIPPKSHEAWFHSPDFQQPIEHLSWRPQFYYRRKPPSRTRPACKLGPM